MPVVIVGIGGEPSCRSRDGGLFEDGLGGGGALALVSGGHGVGCQGAGQGMVRAGGVVVGCVGRESGSEEPWGAVEVGLESKEGP